MGLTNDVWFHPETLEISQYIRYVNICPKTKFTIAKHLFLHGKSLGYFSEQSPLECFKIYAHLDLELLVTYFVLFSWMSGFLIQDRLTF